MTRKTARSVRRVALLLLVASLSATCAAALPRPGDSPWRSPGLLGNGGWPFARVAITPEDAAGASYAMVGRFATRGTYSRGRP